VVQQCAHCGSFDIMAGLDMYQCLQCGFHTHANGTAIAPPPIEEPVTWPGRANIDATADR
jgi:hypothetical protein